MDVIITTRRGERYRLGERDGLGAQSAGTTVIAVGDRQRAQAVLRQIVHGSLERAALRRLLRSLHVAVQRLSDGEVLAEVATRLANQQLQLVRQAAVEPWEASGDGAAAELPQSKRPAAAPVERTDDSHWIEILLVDEEGYPVAGVDYELELPGSGMRRGHTNHAGMVRVERIEAGQCRFSYHQLDHRLWQPTPLPPEQDGREPITIRRQWERYDARYQVRQGDSVESIAARAGHLWETIWQHGDNAELRQVRKSGHVLYPGDQLFVPQREPHAESLETDKRHAFRYRSVPSKLKVQFLIAGEPRSHAAYELAIDGELRNGQLDGSGVLEQAVSPLAKRATVTFSELPEDPHHTAMRQALAARGLELPEASKKRHEAYHLSLRHLDPTAETTGVQGRLRNLGYDVGEIDGEVNKRTVEALHAFQIDHGLAPTGQLDDASRAKLHDLTND